VVRLGGISNIIDLWPDPAAKMVADCDLHDLLQDALGNLVAYPLWRAGALAGSPADEMAHVFVWAPVITLIVPWVYVLKHYVLWLKPQATQ